MVMSALPHTVPACRGHRPGLIVAAPRSGAGKTTIALGLMRALRRRGLGVQPFKCGPDYIDPAFHAEAAGRASCNLDTWSMRRELIASLVAQAPTTGGIAVVEGVMGLFDGAAGPGQCGTGGTADLAALTGWPVVLVLDVSGQTETAAAIALGCRSYRRDVAIAGVILNRVASARHLALIEPAFARLEMPVLGAVLRNDALALPERHLGLVQASEHVRLEDWLDRLAAVVESQVRIDDVIACARPLAHGLADGTNEHTLAIAPPGQRIALAQDRAFSFVYGHLLQGWRQAGAEVVPFSPLADEAPVPTADAVWLPGGYPELHAGRLASCANFRVGLARAAARGAVVHGECGGYMVLGAGLVDADGVRHAMTGLLALETSFAQRKLHLGYRRARVLAPSPLGAPGASVRGHEFHYASVVSCADDPLVDLADATGAALPERGSRRGSVTGTFFHVVDREPS